MYVEEREEKSDIKGEKKEREQNLGRKDASVISALGLSFFVIF